MIFETKLTEKERLVEINQYGKSIHILKAAPVTRISVLKAGQKIIDTVVWQGMALGGIEFDQIVITSDTPQEIAIWAARTPFDFKQVSTRQQTIMASQKFLGNGVLPLLENDPSRIIARLECDKDIWVGGNDLDVIQGVVQNGRKYKAGQEFELTAYGDLKCWVTDEATAVLYEGESKPSKAVTAARAKSLGRTGLELLGVEYFDVIVPPRMDGIKFDLLVDFKMLKHSARQVALAYTENGAETEGIAVFNVIGGIGADGSQELGVKGYVSPTLSAGAHRFFLIDALHSDWDPSAADSEYVEGENANTLITKVYTKNEVYAVAGTVQIMQERA